MKDSHMVPATYSSDRAFRFACRRACGLVGYRIRASTAITEGADIQQTAATLVVEVKPIPEIVSACSNHLASLTASDLASSRVNGLFESTSVKGLAINKRIEEHV
jgi:hypothetical protein